MYAPLKRKKKKEIFLILSLKKHEVTLSAVDMSISIFNTVCLCCHVAFSDYAEIVLNATFYRSVSLIDI